MPGRISIPLNRVEGDLEIHVDVEDGVVTEAWSAGTMYRGFENILVGRAPLDGLVMTPRICGICSTAHLTAAVRALDAATGAGVPDNAQRVRNLALMTEHIQSDMRHGFLLFGPDLANPAYREQPLFDEAVRRCEPLRGEAVVEVIQETKRILEIISILGGQWPHSSFMVPGGVASVPGAGDLLLCRHLLANYRRWYERRILGCSLERWQQVTSAAALDTWLDECAAHQQGNLGFYVRFARAIGLDKVGRGPGNFISFGALDLPAETAVPAPGSARQLVPAGFAVGTSVQTFDPSRIAEDVTHSWFVDESGSRHPFQGRTQPYASGSEGQRYSWAKAPRYDGAPAETGPLAEMVIAANPLFSNLVARDGPSAFVRELARLVRPVTLFPAMDTWFQELGSVDGELYRPVDDIKEGAGAGLTQASRGALGHWIKIEGGAIARYQVITPTGWNGSPRDSANVRGPWEEALIGTPVHDLDNPVEIGHVVRSFDACLVCTVHTVEHGQARQTRRISV